ncbi:DUF1349 domain-containing protein [Deinococcus sp.]|uniref:DUF1349 domain-containing protein n=1 Tax=Deinococcus sp. TaxID=47478 RepID=UPI0025FF824A|nr:DUF1349 domain-containing protein [Deinococcus sp.]
MFENLHWLNEPPQWSATADMLSVSTGERTDFWRQTFYGFIRDDGHFLFREVSGDFTASVTLDGEYEALYDQLGLMLRVSETTWLKTGIEYTDGLPHLSTVVTRDFSDWSVLALPDLRGKVSIRLTRHGTALRVQFQGAAGRWQLSRLAYLPLPEVCQVGLMCCSPERSGFRARFTDFSVTEPVARELHG